MKPEDTKDGPEEEDCREDESKDIVSSDAYRAIESHISRQINDGGKAHANVDFVVE